MRKANCNSKFRLIERRLAETHMSARERERALDMVHRADAFADAIIWIKEKTAALGALLLNPGFKH